MMALETHRIRDAVDVSDYTFELDPSSPGVWSLRGMINRHVRGDPPDPIPYTLYPIPYTLNPKPWMG
jgi:hypothetical protein